MSRLLALGFATWFHHQCRQWPRVQECLASLLPLAEEMGSVYWSAWGALFLGRVLVERGQVEEGLKDIEQGLGSLRNMGQKLGLTYLLGLFVEAQQKGGLPQEALATLEVALMIMAETGERAWEPELYRLKGELTLQSETQSQESRVTEAEACFQKSTAVAGQQAAKSWELRAATSLARLWQGQGKRAEAREHLAPVYDWFTEGFDTADLKDAKALLDTLGEGQ